MLEACTSYGEKLLREILALKYGDEPAYYNDRPPWLLSPHNWRNLELDIYFPYKAEAWEFNGAGHNGLNDKDKKRICEEMRVKLFCVCESDLLNLVRQLPKDPKRDALIDRIKYYLSKCKSRNFITK